jgi:hypothetical protein
MLDKRSGGRLSTFLCLRGTCAKLHSNTRSVFESRLGQLAERGKSAAFRADDIFFEPCSTLW